MEPALPELSKQARDGKLSRTVLRGGRGGNTLDLPEQDNVLKVDRRHYKDTAENMHENIHT